MARCGAARTTQLFPRRLASAGDGDPAGRRARPVRRAALILAAVLSLLGSFQLGRRVERRAELGQVLELGRRTSEMWDLVGVAESLRVELLRRGVPAARFSH